MAKRVRYKKPKQINPVSVVATLLFGLFVYVSIMFGPAYYRRYKAREVLGEAAYRIGLYGFDQDGELLDGIEDKVKQRLFEVGIDDPALAVTFKLENKEMTITARYQEEITHPLINKVTVLDFSPSVEKEVGLVNWEGDKPKRRPQDDAGDDDPSEI